MASDRPNRLFHNMMAKIAAVPMILTALVVFTGGTIWTVVYSFTKSKLLPKKLISWEEFLSIPVPHWIAADGSLDFSIPTGLVTKSFVGLHQYDRLWSTYRWNVSIENLLIYGLFMLVLSFLIGFILAALMDQKIRFENTFRTIMLYPFALSFIVTGVTWQWLLNPDFGFQGIVRSWGWENFNFDPLYNADIALFGIMIAGLWQGSGLVMVLMLAGLRGIDQEIWKAAKIDGIPTWKTYLRIVIPMMRPVFITTLVLVASSIVKVYDLVVAQTGGGPGISTEMPAKYVYDYMFAGQNLGQGFAASTMMLLAVMVVVIPWAMMEFGGKKRG